MKGNIMGITSKEFEKNMSVEATEKMKIPKEYLERIPNLVKLLGCDENEIYEAIENASMSAKEKGLEGKAYWKYTWNKTQAELSAIFGSTKSKALPFFVYVVGESGLYDAVEKIYKPHAEAINSVAPDGTPLDYREKVFGRENPNRGMPFDKKEWMREIYAIVSDTEDFSDPKIAIITARDKVAEEIAVKNNTFYQARFTFYPNPNNPRYMLNATRGTRFKVLETELQPFEITNKMDVKEVGELEELAYLNKDISPFKQNPILIKGSVRRVYNAPAEDERKKVNVVVIGDENMNEVTCFLPKFLQFPYEEASDVIIVGTLSMTEGNVTVNALGFLPLEMAFKSEA